MQTSTHVHDSWSHDVHDGCIHQVQVIDSRVNFNPYQCCGGVVHFSKDCTTTLPGLDQDKSNKLCSDISHTIGHMSHTLTASTPITDLTSKAILKELDQLLKGKSPWLKTHAISKRYHINCNRLYNYICYCQRNRFCEYNCTKFRTRSAPANATYNF